MCGGGISFNVTCFAMRNLFILLFVALASVSFAQSTDADKVQATHTESAGQPRTADSPQFGYVSYNAMIASMNDYAMAQKQMSALEAKYQEEAKRVEDEFNMKYEEFLDGQKNFPPTILKKRQSELQELLDKNIAFKEESKRLLKDAERDIFAPLHQKLADALRAVGMRLGLAFIINIDGNACPFIHPTQCIDVTQQVEAELNKK